MLCVDVNSDRGQGQVIHSYSCWHTAPVTADRLYTVTAAGTQHLSLLTGYTQLQLLAHNTCHC